MSTPAASEHRPARADLAAGAWLHLPAESLPELRRQPGPGPELPVGLLRQSDEQTVAGVAAVRHAAHGHSLGPFERWGAVAAPRRPGRAAFVQAADRFKVEGAWAVTPHLIPHRTLHSLAGTLSLALPARGPNLGAGGTADALLTALTLLEDHGLPGVWLVLTALDPERPVGPGGGLPAGTHLAALALALVPPRTGAALPRLTVSVSDAPANSGADDFDLFSLVALLDPSPEDGRRPATALLPGGVTLACERAERAPLVRVAGSPVGVGGER